MTNMQNPWVVLKFGGTSVSSRSRWDVITDVVRARLEEGFRPLVVCSAVAGISRTLDRLLDVAVSPEGDHQAVLEEIRVSHANLSDALDLDADALLGDYYDQLERWSRGAALTLEAPPRLRARTLACGELMATTLGAAFLQRQDLGVRWHDARELLTSEDVPPHFAQRRYLSATCASGPDYDLQRRLSSTTDVAMTQGFIARDSEGETVLLGWGGSDTSAAYIASRLEARRLEVWTDVPGMFTANPKEIPSALQLLHLGYDVAQEMAGAGAEVLHPRSIAPAERGSIPIHIRCTQAPELAGTVITRSRELPEPPNVGAHVKAIIPETGLTLFAIESPDIWRQVGYFARVFEVFKEHNVSVGLVSNSETHITAVLDPAPEPLAPATLRTLLRDLERFGRTRLLGPCAAVSIIGHDLQAVLPDLGPALELIRPHGLHLMSQPAGGLNLTFVVDGEAARPLTEALHAHLFDGREADQLFGASWREIFEGALKVE